MSGNLHQYLAEQVGFWRTSGFPHETSTIAEILRWAHAPEGVGFTLRPTQVRALETYWYLRLVEDTPRILDLYLSCFPRKQELLDALGVPAEAFSACDAIIATEFALAQEYPEGPFVKNALVFAPGKTIVDYLARETNVLCVVNTTGTPFFRRQPLRDVVIWYGLFEGIGDGIQKDVAGNIHAFSFDAANAHQFVEFSGRVNT